MKNEITQMMDTVFNYGVNKARLQAGLENKTNQINDFKACMQILKDNHNNEMQVRGQEFDEMSKRMVADTDKTHTKLANDNDALDDKIRHLKNLLIEISCPDVSRTAAVPVTLAREGLRELLDVDYLDYRAEAVEPELADDQDYDDDPNPGYEGEEAQVPQKKQSKAEYFAEKKRLADKSVSPTGK